MIRVKKNKVLLAGVLVVILAGGWLVTTGLAASAGSFQTIREGLMVYKVVLDHVIKHYVDEDKVDTEATKKMIKKSIDGMLGNLDPYTQYIPQSDHENLMIQTKGEYGGLGISIWLLDDMLTVRSVFDGTPAANVGILVGDRIIKIETESTKGLKLDGAVDKLRGKPYTDVTITVLRESFSEPLDFTITRAIVKVPSVSYANVLEGEIGYVRVVRFAKKTTTDLKAAIKKMEIAGMKGMILDLRGNPGGLLQQAFEVGDLFLPRDAMIVYTRGRHESQNQEFKAEHDVFIGNLPLVVLVNRGSASASEIVAGAVQDMDMGLVLGKTTWGKGLVQTVLPVGRGKSALKITTAKYYTPSGRCIQRDEHLKNGALHVEGDSNTSEADTTETQEVYHTAKGRIVYGGGGITPDVEVDQDTLSAIVLDLLRQNIIFKFAVDYVSMLDSQTLVYENLKVDSVIMSVFKKFLKEEEFVYRSDLDVEFDRFEKIVEKEHYDALVPAVDQIKKLIEREEVKDFERHHDEIRLRIKTELAAQLWGNQARIRVGLERDRQLAEALRILSASDEYHQLLDKSKPETK